MEIGSASRSSSRRERATAAVRSRRSSRRSSQRTKRGAGVSDDDRRRRARATACAGRSIASTSSTPGIARAAEERDQRVAVEGLAVRQPQLDRARRRLARARRAPAQLGRRARVDGAHGVVELAHAAEARAERHLRERQVGRLDQRARGLRALRARERHRPGTELGHEDPVELALAEAAGATRGRRRRRGRPRRPRSAGPHGRPRRRGGSRPASRARRRGRSACRPESPPPGRRRSCGTVARCARFGSRAGQLGRQYTPVEVTATKKKPS